MYVIYLIYLFTLFIQDPDSSAEESQGDVALFERHVSAPSWSEVPGPDAPAVVLVQVQGRQHSQESVSYYISSVSRCTLTFENGVRNFVRKAGYRTHHKRLRIVRAGGD